MVDFSRSEGIAPRMVLGLGTGGGVVLSSVLGIIAAVFAVIAWIGWRYFICETDSALPASVNISPLGPARNAGRQKQAVVRTLPRLSPLALVLLLVCATAGGVLAMSGRIALDPLQTSVFGNQQHIHTTLNADTLVPPSPLPPSVFTGTDRPGLETADRDWSRLDPGFAKLALLVFARAEARGFPFILLEGYRSPARQDALAASPVPVTNARAFQSKHQYGLALDAAPLRAGRPVISERDPWAMEAYQVLGEEAEGAGLVWGGRWKLMDFGHIEAPQPVASPMAKK